MIDATEKLQLDKTVDEMQGYAPASAPTVPMEGLPPAPDPPAPRPPASAPPIPSPPTVRLILRELRTGEEYQVSGGRIRIGRGDECELQPLSPGDTSVSRVHAEVVLRPDGTVVVRDARSRNGTLVNGTPITADYDLKKGDRLMLGQGGPELLVEHVSVSGRGPARAPEPPGDETPPSKEALPSEPPWRSFGGKGATVFFREVVETNQKSAARLRWVVWSFVLISVVATGGVYWYSEQRVRATELALDEQRRVLASQQRAAALQVAAAEDYRRLRSELEDARNSSAPAVVVDSLRTALVEASLRTEALEAALSRAEKALADQLSAGDSLRRHAQGELARLRSDLSRATETRVATALLDSLRGAVRAAEQKAAGVDAQIRAIKGANLASIAQANQRAGGLVTAFLGTEIFDGSGFAITKSGYFVTNRHVARPGGAIPDSLYVSMADERFMKRADMVASAPPTGQDLAVLRVRSYEGPYVQRLDWSGAQARQGEPAALIGFPAGIAAALDQTRTVRTSMSAGIFSKVTPELIQFDGFTVGGSSGSPVFNANGEVVAVHRSGLWEAAGLGFAVPVAHLTPLLPPDAKAELGIR